MQTFVMLGKYTVDAVKGISAERTTKVRDIVKKNGGEVRSVYALLGTPDLVIILDLPDVREAAIVSIALTRATGIAFQTAPAISVEDFDKLAAKV